MQPPSATASFQTKPYRPLNRRRHRRRSILNILGGPFLQGGGPRSAANGNRQTAVALHTFQQRLPDVAAQKKLPHTTELILPALDAIAVQRFPQGFTQGQDRLRVIMRASSAAWTHTPNTLPRRSNSSALRKAKRRDSSVKSQNPSSGGATGHANTGEPRRESSAATIAVFKPGTRHASGQSGTTEPKRPLKASIARNSAGFRAMMSEKRGVHTCPAVPALRRLIFRGVRRLFALPQGITQESANSASPASAAKRRSPRRSRHMAAVLRRERQSEEFRVGSMAGNLFPNRNEHDGNTFIVEIRHGLDVSSRILATRLTTGESGVWRRKTAAEGRVRVSVA